MGWDYVKIERRGPVTIVTIDRPDVLNALHRSAHVELVSVFDAFDRDPGQWVAIVTGAGEKSFCAGNDLKAQAAGAEPWLPDSGFGGLTNRLDSNKPFIAAVNGFALGGGMELALACDIVVASENAVFALPEPRVGTAAIAGGLQRLPRQIGLKHAMGMILTGRRVPAAEAARLGFVNEVVPLAGLREAALRWAESICECSPLAIRAAKEAVRKGLDVSLPEAIQQATRLPAVRTLFESEDFQEGPRAFAEKRKPRWGGPNGGD